MKYLATLAATLLATPAFAQPVVVADSGDSAWVLVASLLVLVAALPGLVLLRARGAGGAAVFIGTATTALAMAIIGYSLAFGEGSIVLGGAGNALLANLADLRVGLTIPESLYVLFETAVAAFALAILASAVAGRARLAWFVPFALIWLLIVYVPAARWLWGGGWLAELGAIDFAGGIVVHTVAGVAALVIGLLLRGRSTDDEPLAVSLPGAALLWIGWLGMIGGAAFGGGDDAASAIIDGLLGSSAGLLLALALGAWRTRALAIEDGVVGLIAGLAAVSTAAGFVGPLGAMVLGVVGALVAVALTGRLARLGGSGAGDAFVAHGVGGMLGAVLFPVFVLTALGGPGLDEGQSMVTQLVAQVIAVVAIALWTAVATVIAALSVSMVVPMREDRL